MYNEIPQLLKNVLGLFIKPAFIIAIYFIKLASQIAI